MLQAIVATIVALPVSWTEIARAAHEWPAAAQPAGAATITVFSVAEAAAIAQDLLTISGVVTTRADGLPVPGATAQNLFDVFPDRNSSVNSFNGIQTFPRQSPFGMNGRTIYTRIGRRF